jgi:hypothetical protein
VSAGGAHHEAGVAAMTAPNLVSAVALRLSKRVNDLGEQRERRWGDRVQLKALVVWQRWWRFISVVLKGGAPNDDSGWHT